MRRAPHHHSILSIPRSSSSFLVGSSSTPPLRFPPPPAPPAPPSSFSSRIRSSPPHLHRPPLQQRRHLHSTALHLARKKVSRERDPTLRDASVPSPWDRPPESTSRAHWSATLPPGYTYYPLHGSLPPTPPPMSARIYTSSVPPPHLPRKSVFQYLFPPGHKGKQTHYYPPPDKKDIAFIDALTERYKTRGEVEDDAVRLSSGLKALGVRRGHVACILGMNSLEWINACFACQAGEVIVSPANYGYTPPELLHQLTDSGASVVFVQPELLPMLEKALSLAADSTDAKDKYSLHPSRILLLCLPKDKPAETPYKSIYEIYAAPAYSRRLIGGEEKDTAYLCYSSGTTGRAKGVETSHHNMTSQVQAVNTVYEPLTKGDTILGVLPFGHIYGLALLVHQPLTVGVPVVILPKFDELQVLKAIEKYHVTWSNFVPPMLLALRHSKHFDSHDLSSLRGIMLGAAPCGTDLIRAFESRFPKVASDAFPASFGQKQRLVPQCLVTQGYGLTETSPVSHVMTLAEGHDRPGMIGRIMPTSQCRVVDPESGEDVREGEQGEIWLRGPSVMKGYWKNDEATKAAFAQGGWFKTGDVGVVDHEGYFKIVDRVKELIKYKGYQVPPADLEALLLTHPRITDSGVIAVYSSEQATELPRAYVVAPNVPPEEHEAFGKEIERWVAERVAGHKRLRGGVVVVDAVPKSPSGKILRKLLRERAKVEWVEEAGKRTRLSKL